MKEQVRVFCTIHDTVATGKSLLSLLQNRGTHREAVVVHSLLFVATDKLKRVSDGRNPSGNGGRLTAEGLKLCKPRACVQQHYGCRSHQNSVEVSTIDSPTYDYGLFSHIRGRAGDGVARVKVKLVLVGHSGVEWGMTRAFF